MVLEVGSYRDRDIIILAIKWKLEWLQFYLRVDGDSKRLNYRGLLDYVSRWQNFTL